MLGPQHNYGLQFKLKLSRASQQPLTVEAEETATNLVITPLQQRPSLTVHQERARRRAKVSPSSLLPPSHSLSSSQVSRAVVQGKAVTRPADVVKEIRRGSMKEKWGFAVSYR